MESREGRSVLDSGERHTSERAIGWSKYMSEQQGILNAHVETLTKAYNELARLLDEG